MTAKGVSLLRIECEDHGVAARVGEEPCAIRGVDPKSHEGEGVIPLVLALIDEKTTTMSVDNPSESIRVEEKRSRVQREENDEVVELCSLGSAREWTAALPSATGVPLDSIGVALERVLCTLRRERCIFEKLRVCFLRSNGREESIRAAHSGADELVGVAGTRTGERGAVPAALRPSRLDPFAPLILVSFAHSASQPS